MEILSIANQIYGFKNTEMFQLDAVQLPKDENFL